MSILLGLIAATTVLAGPQVAGQPAPTDLPTGPSQAAQPSAAPALASDYRIGPGDLLMVSVFGVPEVAQQARVSNSGRIHLTKLGVLSVAERTATQLEQDIAARYRERGLLLDPWVTVRVTEVRAHPVYVLGEVMTPGQYQLATDMYLADLVTLAQGVNEVSSPTAFLYRRKVNPLTGELDATTSPADDRMEAIPVDLRALQTGSNPALNVKLRGGDILYVPERKKEFYFILGAVGSPGLFELTPGQGPLRLSQAMARAGGPTPRAKSSKITIVRYEANGDRRELTVDFPAVMRGTQPDVTLQQGDVVFIPGSRLKSAGLAMVGVIPGVVQGRVVQR
jgi:polysaccharide export outer membrane protein